MDAQSASLNIPNHKAELDKTSQYNGTQIYKRLVYYSLDHWKWLALAILGLVISASTQPLFASLMEPLLDKTFMDKDPDTIKWMPAVILVIFLTRGIASFLSGYFLGKVGRTVIMKLRKQLFDKLLHVPISYYDHHSNGEILAKMTYHVEQLATASTKGLTVLVQDTIIIIGLLGVMLYYSWQLTLGMLIIAPLITFLVLYVTKRFRRLSRKLQDSVGSISQIADESISAQREVRIFDGLEYEKKRYQVANQNNLNLHIKRMMTEQVSTPLIQFLVAVALAVIIFIATQDSVIATLTPGRFMSFVIAMVFLLTPIQRLSKINVTLQQGIAAGQSIFALIDQKSEKNTGKHVIERANGHFLFKDVSFHYEPYHANNVTQQHSTETETHENTTLPTEGQNTVIKSLSFEVNSGESIALVGKSGSGKTTLVNLLPRFYDYQSGSISLDGQAITAIELSSLRRQFAYVGQQVTLFNDTIKNNIAYGGLYKTHSDADIKEAALAANALEFIEQLPQGFDTLIGDNGVLLSGGQRQRLAIARAILSDAPILILDEATSALDTESERHIQGALEQLIQNRTTFIIAHRLSTIENADRILVMDNGKIIESGTHTELLQQEGTYAKLHAMQFHDNS